MKTCNNCNHSGNPVNAMICSKCGYDLNSAPPPQPKNNLWKWYVYAIAGIIGGTLAVVFIYPDFMLFLAGAVVVGGFFGYLITEQYNDD